MSDRIEELFARTRPLAVQTIRPPGAGAARKTLRRRRRRRTTMLAAAAVLAVLGGVVVRMDAPAVREAEPPASPAQLAELAQVTLGPATGPAPVEKQGEVTSGWSAPGFRFLGEQTLLAVCVGTGSMTLLVSGVPGSENLSKEPIGIARLEVPCSTRPVPVSTRYVVSHAAVGVEYSIVDAESAAGRAGFAFRVVTTDTGEPLTDQDERANTSYALHLTEEESLTQYGWGASVHPGGENQDDLPAWIGGRFKVAAACAGNGVLKVEIRRATGKTVDSWELPCRWPPQRYDWSPAKGSGDLVLNVAYVPATDSRAAAEISVQFDPN